MTFRHILVLISLIGISATFMPWLHFPKNGVIFYGYLADGLLTGFFFISCLIYLLATSKNEHINKIVLAIMAILGLVLAFGAYTKIKDINLEKLTFTSDDPLIISMSAGFHEGIGIYVFGIAGLAMCIAAMLSLINDLLDRSGVKIHSKGIMDRPYLVSTLVLLITASLTWVVATNSLDSTPKKEELQASISKSVDSMASAFINQNYDHFISYTHPIMLQSIGGVEKTVALLRSTNETLKERDTKVSKIVFSDLYDIENDGQTIQALVSQKVTYESGEGSKDELQKMIAISEDRGKSWKYINIGDNTKVEMTKLFPVINPNLEF